MFGWRVMIACLACCGLLRVANVTANAGSSKQSDAVIFPHPDSWVNDYAGILTPAEKHELDTLLREFEKATSNQIFVAIMKTLPADFGLEEYANELFERWKPGEKDRNNGVLLVVFINDRKLRIEVGYGLEAELTDAACKLIITYDIAPSFKQQHYFQGLKQGLSSILGTLQGTYTPRKPKRPFTSERLFEWILPGLCIGFSGLHLLARFFRDTVKPFVSPQSDIGRFAEALETQLIPHNPFINMLSWTVVVLTITGLLIFFLPEDYKYWAAIFLLTSPILISLPKMIKKGRYGVGAIPEHDQDDTSQTFSRSSSSHAAGARNSSGGGGSPRFSGGGGSSGGGGASGSW